MTKRLSCILYKLLPLIVLLITTGCSDAAEEWFANGDLKGEAVCFASQIPAGKSASKQRATADTEFLNNYTAVNKNYQFTVTMLQSGQDDANATSATYNVDPEHSNGQLVSSTPLYWQDNVNAYAFKAEAGSQTLAADQTTEENWILQDKLHGYAYEPLLDDDNAAFDNPDALNFHKSREWYNYNKVWMDALGLSESSDYKRVPLFLQHDRALVTVILKAGDGVKREDVLAATAAEKIETKIFSYDESGTALEISPLAGKETISYDKDVNGPAADNEVARYDAVVEPHNYLAKAEEEKICAVNLASQHFSFYAGNDSRYADYAALDDEAKLTSEIHTAYNLKAGDNLVITVTLSRESRKIMLTAYVQPWTSTVTSYVCDDFGNSGDPTIINNRQELEDFLSDEDKNVAGSVAILNTDQLTLTDWDDKYDLNAIFNLGNHKLTTNSKLFRNISASGSLINGTISVTNNTTTPATIVCTENRGTVDHITLQNTNEEERATVSRAAVAVSNYGYITNVTSYIAVNGVQDGTSSTTYIGGIAAISQSETGTTLPSISNCLVNARVGIANGQSSVCGGGIVGAANGYVANNTFEYGITLQQTLESTIPLRNIVHTKLGDTPLYATGNEWPTVTGNTPTNSTEAILNNRDEALRYNAVIDCQTELNMLIAANSSYNATGRSYRLSDNFTVLSQTWGLNGKTDGRTNATRGNVLFTLDGNDKTITLDGTATVEYKERETGTATGTYTTAPMLFSNISGMVKNLNLNICQNIYGVPVYGTSGDNMSSDVVAPLAYSVIGGTVENVSAHAVKMSSGNYPKVIAALPAGLVVWACNGAVIRNCTSDLDIQMKVANLFASSDQRLYAGGIVAQAAKATITQCQYVSNEGFQANKNNTMFCFGGIVGGTVQKTYEGVSQNENPELSITDCSSWYTFDADKTAFTEGSIIGRSIYSSDNKSVNGVLSDCQGNWWPTGVNGVGEALSTATGYDEKVIGKRNSVTPDKP